MISNSEDFKTVISAFAAGISALGALVAIVSVLIGRRNWLESNRPIVTAFVDEESSGDGITIFNLHMRNSGTRPATDIRVIAKPEAIRQLLEVDAQRSYREQIEAVFSEESKIAVLHQGESLITSFGLATTNPSEKWLRYGHEIRIRIHHGDLEGRTYRSSLSLKLKPRAGFGGGLWRNAA